MRARMKGIITNRLPRVKGFVYMARSIVSIEGGLPALMWVACRPCALVPTHLCPRY